MSYLSLLDAALYGVPQCEYGYYAGGECWEPATVHHLGAELYFCQRHFNRFDAEVGDQFEPQWNPPAIQSHTGTVVRDLSDLVERTFAACLPKGRR